MFNLFKYANYLTMNNLLCLIALIIGIQAITTVDPYTEIGNSISGSTTLYDNATALAQGPPAITFLVLYPSPRQSNAQLVIGLVGYEQRDNIINSYFKLGLVANTLTHFSINLLSMGSNLVYMTKIMYIALQDLNNAFYCLWIEFPSFSNISTGSGPRVDNKFSSFYQITGGAMLNANLSLNRVYTYLTGFHIQAINGNFGLEIGVSITNQISFTTTIKAQFDCLIQYVQGMLFFIDIGKFTIIRLFAYSETITADSSPQTFNSNYVNSFGNKIYGVFHIKATGTRSTGAITKFNLQIDNATVTNVGFTTFQKVQFTYIFIGLLQCKSSYPYYSDYTFSSCTDQCASSMTQSPTSNICTPCLSPCSQCLAIQTQCLACISGYQLNSGTCSQVIVADQSAGSSDSKLYLLGLLGFVPIAILVVYLCRRSSKVKFNKTDFMSQPAMGLT